MSNKQKGTKKEQAIEKICNLISCAYETKDNKWIAEMLYNGIIERISKVAARAAKELFVKIEAMYKETEPKATATGDKIAVLTAETVAQDACLRQDITRRVAKRHKQKL